MMRFIPDTHWMMVLGLAGGLTLPAAAQTQPLADPAFKAQFDLGTEALKAGRYKEAINEFKKANQLGHNACGECYFLTAVAHSHTNDLGQSLKDCDLAIETATGDSLRALAHNLKGRILLMTADKDNKKLKASESELRAASELSPKVAALHLDLARLLLLQSRDEEAKQELQLCLALDPEEKIAKESRLMLADPRRGREDLAPAFDITTLQGQQISLKQLAGHVVVLDFWATWCAPCRASVPELKDLTRKYSSEKLTLISVSADKDDNAWRDFVAKKNMTWAQYRDSDHKVLDAFGIHSFPTYLVIDGDGFIKERVTGMDPQESVVARLKRTLVQMPQLEGEVRK